jgi:hypothetical protein
MKFLKGITGVLALAAFAALAPSSSAQTLKVLTAGSSAQFGPFAVAAYALATNNGRITAYHYTVKSGACPTITASTCLAALNDTRTAVANTTGTLNTIPPEPGNLWVVWNANYIWAYLSVDSTVGVRAFSAYPRAKLALASLSTLPVSATTNYTYWGDGTKDTALTSTVYAALSGTSLTAANTDIRPEDALYATNRTLNQLGYGSVADLRSGHSGQYLIGNAIESHFTSAVAHPVSFAITGGADPFSTAGAAGPTEITLPIGAAPVVFLANTSTGSTVANATNITSNDTTPASNNAALLFSGLGNCASTLVSGSTGLIDPILREPLSGTMNTAEFTAFEPTDPSTVLSTGYSQETGITTPTVGTNQNPLALPCPSTSTTNFRYRAVGTGDEVNGVINTPNSLGYAFFSYESVNGGHADKYLQLNGIDPINATYSTGALPTCAVVSGSYDCPVGYGDSFPNLRNGTYPAWSIYRMITDSTGQANAQALVNETQKLVNNVVPDFVPFLPVCGTTASASDPGLTVYREHFVPSTITSTPDTVSITASDGSLPASISCSGGFTLTPAAYGGGTEAGGDVGGIIISSGATTETTTPH